MWISLIGFLVFLALAGMVIDAILLRAACWFLRYESPSFGDGVLCAFWMGLANFFLGLLVGCAGVAMHEVTPMGERGKLSLGFWPLFYMVLFQLGVNSVIVGKMLSVSFIDGIVILLTRAFLVSPLLLIPLLIR